MSSIVSRRVAQRRGGGGIPQGLVDRRPPATATNARTTASHSVTVPTTNATAKMMSVTKAIESITLLGKAERRNEHIASSSSLSSPSPFPSSSAIIASLYAADEYAMSLAAYRLAASAGMRTSMADDVAALEAMQRLGAGGERGPPQGRSAAADTPPSSARADIASHLLAPYLTEMASASKEDTEYDDVFSANVGSSSSSPSSASSVVFHEQSLQFLRMIRSMHGDWDGVVADINGGGDFHPAAAPPIPLIPRHPALDVVLHQPTPLELYTAHVMRRLQRCVDGGACAASTEGAASADNDQYGACGGGAPSSSCPTVVDVLADILCGDLFGGTLKATAAAMRGGSSSSALPPAVVLPSPSQARGGGGGSSSPSAVFDLPLLLNLTNCIMSAQMGALLSPTPAASSSSALSSSSSPSSQERLLESLSEDGSLARIDDVLLGLFQSQQSSSSSSSSSLSLSSASSSTTDPPLPLFTPVPGQQRFSSSAPPLMPSVLGATERLERIVGNIVGGGGGGGGSGVRRMVRGTSSHGKSGEEEGRSLIIVDSALVLAQPRRVIDLLQRGECLMTFCTLHRVLTMATGGGSGRNSGNPKAVAFIQSLVNLRTNHVSSNNGRMNSSSGSGIGNHTDSNGNNGGTNGGNGGGGGMTMLGLQEELLLTSLAVAEFGLKDALAVGGRAHHHHRDKRAGGLGGGHHAMWVKAFGRGAHPLHPSSLPPSPSSSSSPASSSPMAFIDPAVRERVSILSAAKAIGLILEERCGGGGDDAHFERDGVPSSASVTQPSTNGLAAVDDFFADIGLGPMPTSSHDGTASPSPSASSPSPLLHTVQLSIAARDPILLAMAHQQRLHVLLK